MLIITIKFALEIILSLYGFFKIDDYHYSSNCGTWLFEKLESSKIICFLLCLRVDKYSENESIKIELNSLSPFFLTQNINGSPESRAKKIKIEIDRMISLKDKAEIIESDFTFTIRTSLESDDYQYISEKQMKDFYCFANFFRSVNPDIITFEIVDETSSVLNTDDLHEFIEKNELMIQGIVDNPIHLKLYYNKISTFLNLYSKKKRIMIPTQKRNRFIEFSPLIQLKKINVNERRKTKEGLLFDNLDFPEQNSSLLRIFFFKISPLDFKENSLTNIIEYQFQISTLIGNIPKSWIISKSYSCFNKLTKDLEEQTNGKIDIFDKLVPKAANFKISMERDFILRRKEGLFQYLDHITKKLCYHGDILYNFLNFDSDKGNINTPKYITIPLNPSALIRINSAKINQIEENVKFFHLFDQNFSANPVKILRKLSYHDSGNLLKLKN